MERLKCFICRQYINGGLNGLVQHFQILHGLTINRGYGPSGFECGQNGCRRRFALFNSMRQHIRRAHLSNQDPLDREIVNNPVLDAQENDIGLNDEPMHIDNNDDVGEFEDAEENEQFDLLCSVIRMIGRL